jgi:hypothetical protein
MVKMCTCVGTGVDALGDGGPACKQWRCQRGWAMGIAEGRSAEGTLQEG